MASSNLLEKYKQLLVNLLPRGKLWQPKEQPIFKKLLDSFAAELCRVEERGRDLLREADPRQALELLEDFERLLGLPDECSPEGPSLQERRDQILRSLTNVGGLSKEFYEFIGLQLGFVITVENRVNFIVGRGTVGQPLSNYFNRTFVVGDTVGTQLKEIGWRYYFNVEMPATAANIFVVGDTVGNPLVEFSNPLIECTMRKLKPAHSAVTFTFS